MKKKSKDETADELRPEYDLAPCSRKVRVGNMPRVTNFIDSIANREGGGEITLISFIFLFLVQAE